jgi:hypothetical protein
MSNILFLIFGHNDWKYFCSSETRIARSAAFVAFPSVTDDAVRSLFLFDYIIATKGQE